MTECNHQRDALGELHNQASIVRFAKDNLKPGVRGLSKQDLRRDTLTLYGMLVMYRRVFGYGHEEVKPYEQLCYEVMGSWGERLGYIDG